MKLQSFLQRFISLARESEQITIYNQAVLLHELTTLLQQHLPEERYGVQISRNTE